MTNLYQHPSVAQYSGDISDWIVQCCRDVIIQSCIYGLLKIVTLIISGIHCQEIGITYITIIATVTLGVWGDSASSPWPLSRRAGWPSFGLQTDHIPPSLSPIAITRVSSLGSFNILACSSRAGHVIHLGASTNIRNNLPSFPYPTPPHSPLFYF